MLSGIYRQGSLQGLPFGVKGFGLRGPSFLTEALPIRGDQKLLRVLSGFRV